MKKIVLGLMPLVIGSMLLAGCNAKKGGEEGGSSSEAIVCPESAQALLWDIAQTVWGEQAEESDVVEATDSQTGETYWKLAYAIGFEDEEGDGFTNDDATEEFLASYITGLAELFDYLVLAEGPTFTADGLGEGVNLSDAYYLTADQAIVCNIYDYVHPSYGQVFVSVAAWPNAA